MMMVPPVLRTSVRARRGAAGVLSLAAIVATLRSGGELTYERFWALAVCAVGYVAARLVAGLIGVGAAAPGLIFTALAALDKGKAAAR